MKAQILKTLLLLSFLLHPSLTWAMQGHSIIASIAETRLKSEHPQIWLKIEQMLSGLRDHFPESPNTFMESAAIPDLLNFEFQGFMRVNHFRDTPVIYPKDSAKDLLIPSTLPPEDVITGLNRALNIIKASLEPNYTSVLKRGFMDSLMLRYLVHLVGDIHQPLHAATLYAKDLFDGSIRGGDEGGNLIPVNDVFGKGYHNLHSLFDNAFNAFDYTNITFPYSAELQVKIEIQAAYLVDSMPEEGFGNQTQNLQFSDWLQESFEIAESFAYSQVEMFPVLGPEFLLTGRTVCLQRMVLAGYRLFYLLRTIFGPQTPLN